jgi:hypothetical protein
MSSIEESADAAANWAKGMEESQNVLTQASKMAASKLLSNEDGTSNYNQEAVDAGALAIRKKEQQLIDTLEEQIAEQYSKGDKKSDIGNKGEDDVLKRYEEAMGGYVNWAENAIRGTENNRKFVYMEDGDEKILTKDEIIAAVAAYESA